MKIGQEVKYKECLGMKVHEVYKNNNHLWESMIKAKRDFKLHCDRYGIDCRGCKYEHDLGNDCEYLFYKEWSGKNDK